MLIAVGVFGSIQAFPERLAEIRAAEKTKKPGASRARMALRKGNQEYEAAPGG
jgi:hypothetical protein